MAIDLQSERLLSLTDATKTVPVIDGKRPHVSTVWRWCRKGVRGVRLEHVRLGHRICTSGEALNRFANRLAEVDTTSVERESGGTPKPRTSAQRQRDIERADAELSAAGI